MEDILKNEGDNLKFKENIEITQETKSLLRDLLRADPNKRLNWK